MLCTLNLSGFTSYCYYSIIYLHHTELFANLRKNKQSSTFRFLCFLFYLYIIFPQIIQCLTSFVVLLLPPQREISYPPYLKVHFLSLFSCPMLLSLQNIYRPITNNIICLYIYVSSFMPPQQNIHFIRIESSLKSTRYINIY